MLNPTWQTRRRNYHKIRDIVSLGITYGGLRIFFSSWGKKTDAQQGNGVGRVCCVQLWNRLNFFIAPQKKIYPSNIYFVITWEKYIFGSYLKQ
jgi:hypothetical protein